jgi:hypothetical protein
MRRRARIWTVGLALSFIAFQCVSAEAARLGRLRGVICDQGGAPLVGATIAIFDAASESDEPIRNALTDADGQFTASVAPGRYVLRAIASGFSAVEARALVAANRETVLDSISLRRVNTLADRKRNVSDRYRHAARSARGHVLHMDEDLEAQREREAAEAIALTDEASSTHGVVQAVAVSGRSDYVATNFAVSHRTLGSDLTIVGQTGAGEDAPQRIEALTATDIGDAHRLAVAFGYGQLRTHPIDDELRLSQYTLEVTDRWQVAGPLVLVYGVNYTRFSGASDADSILPRVGVEVAATPQTQIFAGLRPGSSLTEIARFNFETGEVTFTEPARVGTPGESGGMPVLDRSRRMEVGVGHLLDEQSNIEVMAFFDTASGRGIGLLAVPSEGGDPEFTTGALNGRTSGMRVLYTRRFSDVLTGTVGYALGRGQRLSAVGLADRLADRLADPISLYEPATFNVVATRLDAEFDTGTRISALYRFSPKTVVFAIDPFAGRLTAYEPSASFLIAQSLPSFGFLPGQWEATLDVRNIFDTRPRVDDSELSLSDYRRLVRAGLSLRF